MRSTRFGSTINGNRLRLVGVGLALLAFLVTTASVAAGHEGSEHRTEQGNRRDRLVAEVASYDLAVGPAARFAVGLFTADHRFVGWGSPELRFVYLGNRNANAKSEPRVRLGPLPARFLPLPGVEIARIPSAPRVLPARKGRGVYATEVAFPEAGFWNVKITAARNGGTTQRTTAAFEVQERHTVPTPGEPVPASVHPILTTPDVPLAAIDSRATQGTIPDPELHERTIADAIGAGHPALVVFSTPTFCTSRMCGPITEMVQELSRDYADRAEFIHIEIWRDFDRQRVNDTATEWLARDTTLREPWVFLIDADGRIVARWDNVATRPEIEPLLRALPPLASS